MDAARGAEGAPCKPGSRGLPSRGLQSPELQDKLEREQKDIAKRIARLVVAIATSGNAAQLVAKLRGRLTFTPRVDPISGEADGYDFSGPTRFDKLFTGIAVETPAWIKASTSRKGFEGTTHEDNFDGYYGRLLERAYEKSVKVLASPRGTGRILQVNEHVVVVAAAQ